jgi:uncharacterized protein YjaZ
MHTNIIDTAAIYERMLTAADAAERTAILQELLVQPFAPMTRMMGPDPLAAFAMWGQREAQFGPEQRAATITKLELLHNADAWARAAGAVARSLDAFAPYTAATPLEQITFALLLTEPMNMPGDRGYSGFGSFPGYVITLYTAPDAYNLARVEPCTAHELNHTIRFSHFPFNPMSTTLGEYMVAEGLAEAFAAELYGEELVGYYVSEFDRSREAETLAIVGNALNSTGFDVIRSFIFGDAIAAHMGLPVQGVPEFTGYAVGYNIVRAYMQRTGSSAAAATFVPAEEIIAGSGMFPPSSGV